MTVNGEKNLVDRLKSDDPAAFRELVDSQLNRVINICYRFVRDRQEAEDLAQEVFLEVHRSIARFREKSTLSTWIYRIAVTKSLDRLRRKKRKKRLDFFGSRLGGEREIEGVAAPSGYRPDSDLKKVERFRALNTALEKLPKTSGSRSP